ncbi:MAG: response regulator, partial [Tabrizicola sp.]
QAMTLLLVEDNPINRLVAREMLQAAGHQVVEAHDGREGVRLAGMKRFDAILMDISMPELDGVQATRIIRSEDGPNRRTPIIALTAHAMPEDTRRFLEAGINDTLLKPLGMETLNGLLARVADADSHAPERPAGLSKVIADLARQIGAAPARHLLTGFRAEGEALVQRFGTVAWSDETAEARAQAVHKLAGSAAVLGANTVRAILQGLEGSYRRGDFAEASAGLGQLAGAWLATRDEIDRMLADPVLDGDVPADNGSLAAGRPPS